MHRNGVKLKLTGQPVQVLAILLERPGHIVTREELQQRLWPDTFVDVEHNLNTAIKKIREVLSDSADNPRFIETLPRRGYRFIAPVSAPTPMEPQAPSDEESPVLNRPSLASSSLRKHRSVIVGAIFAAIVVVGLVALFVLVPRRTNQKQTMHRIAVLPLANLSADPQQEYFADGMTEQLINQLAHTPEWEVISRTTIMRYKAAKLSLPQIAKELSADWVMEGAIQRSGGRVRISAKLVDSQTDTRVWSGTFEHDLTEVFALQDEIARSIADQAGVTLSRETKWRLNHKVVPQPSMLI